MNSKHIAFVILLFCAATCSTALADNYNYEIGFTADSSRSDFRSVALGPQGAPLIPPVTVAGYSDRDELSVLGTWYLTGLSDDEGPKARAAFLSRASSLSVAYTRGDGESDSTTLTLPPFPISTRVDDRSDALSVALRYLIKDSDWFGTAAISRIEIETDFGQSSSTFEFDATAYGIGVGRYLGRGTAFGVTIGRTDSDADDATTFALDLTHLGSIGDTWRYGIDAAFSKSDARSDDGTYSLRSALYPNADLEFGIELRHQRFDGGFDSTGVAGFVSWFARPNVELFARYGTVDEDESPGLDVDNENYGIGVSMRF